MAEEPPTADDWILNHQIARAEKAEAEIVRLRAENEELSAAVLWLRRKVPAAEAALFAGLFPGLERQVVDAD